MTLEARIRTKLHRLPQVDRDADFPLPEGTNALPQPLRLHGTADEPDVFRLEDRISLHTVEETPQHAGRRYAALERVLAERAGIQRLPDEDTADGPAGGESTNSAEGEV